MSEEVNNEGGGFLSNLKTQIATGAGIILTGIGTMFMDEVKSFVGIEDEEPSAIEAPVQSNHQSVNVSGPDIVINIPEQPTQTTTIIKEVPVEPVKKKEVEEEIDW